MAVSQTMAYLHSSVVVAFLFLWECCLLLCCWLVQLISWLVICVFRVACDFVSRLGGWDTYFFIERLVETSLGGPRFRGSGAQVSTRIPSPSVLAHGSSLCTTHVVFEVRPRSGHLQAAGCMRWQLDGCFTNNGLPALVGRRCIPLSLNTVATSYDAGLHLS